MGSGIHRRDTDDGPRYRIWNTTVDCYVTPPLTRDEMRERLAADEAVRIGSAVERRLHVVDVRGTSFVDERDHDISGPWEAERCRTCSGFHHAWEPSGFAADYRPDMSEIDEGMAREINKVIAAGRADHLLAGCEHCGLTCGDPAHGEPCGV